MKTYNLLVLFGLLCLISNQSLFAQVNAVTCTDLVVDKDGNTYVCGYFQGEVQFGKTRLESEEGSTDIYLAKYSEDGKSIWAVKAGGKDTDVARGITMDTKGYIYVTGSFQDYASFEHRKVKSRGQNDVFIAKYNSSGGINRMKTYGSTGDEIALAIDVDSEGSIYTVGNFTDRFSVSGNSVAPVGTTSAFMLKLTEKGTVEWVKQIGNEDGQLLVNDLDVDRLGNVFLCGGFTNTLLVGNQSLESKGGLDGFVLMLTSSGGLNYLKLYGTENTDFARTIYGDGSGSAIVAGHTIQGMSAKTGFVYQLDSKGEIRKKDNWEVSYETNFQDLIITPQYNVVISGSFTDFEQFDNYPVNSRGLDGFILTCDKKIQPISAFAPEGDFNGTADLLSVGLDGNIHIGLNRPRKEGVREQSVFLAQVSQMTNIKWSTEVGSAERFDKFPDGTYVDFKGKLLAGEKALEPISDGHVELVDEGGNVLESTRTDNYGDFIFHNLNAQEEYSINAPDAYEKAGGQPVFIANQSGVVLGKMAKDGSTDFKYKVLPAELNKIAQLESEDTQLKVERFLEGNEKSAVIDMQLYYEPGAYQIPDVYLLELKNLARKLRTGRDITISIASYTDANGDANDNLTLSNQRAKAIVDFMISRKVKPDVISGKGYGEQGIINRCTDGVDCSDREHQANRRTEIILNRKS
ncbi:MAG: OmpA family protein [Salibacteraceae bacterium]